MSERPAAFLDGVLHRYFGVDLGSCPLMRRGDLERLLTDDAHRRRACSRLAAVEWGDAETHSSVVIESEFWVITPRGLLYAAGLAGGSRVSLYYLGVPSVLFEPIVERTAGSRMPQGAATAVDSRLNRDLVFPWPLDAALRRTLDTHEVLRVGRGEP